MDGNWFPDCRIKVRSSDIAYSALNTKLPTKVNLQPKSDSVNFKGSYRLAILA